MNRRISCLAALLLALLAAGPLFAFDYGLSLDNSSTLEWGDSPETDPELQRDKVSLWGEQFWSGAGGARYRLLFNLYYLYTNKMAFLAEPDLLKFEMSRPDTAGGGVLDLALGRFRFFDLTGIVLDHGADGAFAELDYSVFRFSVGAGYTGLHLKPESDINMSAADWMDDGDDGVHFAPRRLFEILTVRFPEIIPRQKLSVEALAQQDRRSGSGGTLDSFHTTLRWDGAAWNGFYHDLSVTGAFNLSENFQGLMARGALRWFGEDFYGSRAAAEFLYAGEDFFTLSTPTLGLVNNPAPADLLRLSLDYSIRPWNRRFSPALRNLAFSAAGRLYFTSRRAFLGQELEGGLVFRPSVDFGASLTAGLWAPEGGDYRGLVRLDFSIGL